MEGDPATPGRRVASPGATAAAPAAKSPSFLSAVAAGRFSSLSAVASADKTADDGGEDVDMDAHGHGDAALTAERFLPLLVRLQHAQRSCLQERSRRRRIKTPTDAAAAAVDALLLGYDEANTLRMYAAVMGRLEHADVERFEETLVQEMQPQGASLPLYRQFESGTPEQRACLVLSAVRTFASGSPASSLTAATAGDRSDELFMNDIYRSEVAAVLVLALASPKLQQPWRTRPSPFRRAAVVRFCLSLPVGAALVASIVENDPASGHEVLDTLARALAQLTTGKVLAQQEREAMALTTELPREVVAVQDATVTLAKLSPLHAAVTRDKLRAVESLWAVAVVLHLHFAAPSAFSASRTPPTPLASLRDDATAFLLDWMRAPASPLVAFLRIAAGRASGEDKAAPSPFQQVAEHLLELVKDQLLDDLERAATPADATGAQLSPLAVSATLGLWISLLSLGNLRLTDHEAMRLVRSLDRLSKQASSRRSARVVSLAFVAVLLVCHPLAPVLSKIPSQRDESTKAVASLAQHCVVSLYNASAAARPLLIVSAVLLYTKSPALLPLLASVVGDANAFHSAAQPTSSGSTLSIRAEYLHVVGDVVLKQVLTENLMARDVLADNPPLHVSASDRDQLRDMPLRAIHGLLCEKSFLRFHHGRRLEAWLARMIGGAEPCQYSTATEHEPAILALPVHPLLLSVLLEWIDNYVMAFEYPIAQKPTLHLAIVPLRPTLVYRWLSAPCLHAHLQADSASKEEQTTWARALLALAYALQFNQRLRHAVEVPGSKLSAVSASMNGSDGVSQPAATGGDIVLRYELDQFPLRNMLVQAMASGGVGQAFEFVAPTLHRLMMDEFPGRVSLPPLGDRLAEHDVERAWFQSSGSILSRNGRDESFSWAVATLKVAELRDAPAHVVHREFSWLAASLLPQAVSLQQRSLLRPPAQDPLHGSVEEAERAPADAVAFCRVVTELFAKRLRHHGADGWSSDPDVLVRLVHALCYPEWTAKQFAQQQQLLRHGRANSSTTAAVPLVTTYRQLLETPFKLVQDAERAVFRCPPLLELLLLVLRDVRHASSAQLTRCDPGVGLARVSASIQQQQAAPQLPDAMTARAASIQQHELVQDCLLTHALLRELAAMTPRPSENAGQHDDAEPETTEARLLLCAMVDELFAVDAARDARASASPKQPAPPRLLLAVHTQAYAPEVVPWMVERAPSLRLLWTFWMQSKSSSARSSSSSGGGSGGSSASSATSKPLMDFLLGDGSSLDKNAPRAGFRLCVFLSLCARYMTARECAVVAPAMKALWNKLRSALTASANSPAVQSVAAAASTGARDPFARVDGAFLLAVLPLAARACARHPELSAELVQFLLKLQKLLPISTGPLDATLALDDERRLGAAPSPLERALHDAYRTLLQQMGA